jgi:hypothetical protein
MDEYLERRLDRMEVQLGKIETNDLHHLALDMTVLKVDVGMLKERARWLETIVKATFWVGVVSTLTSGISAVPKIIGWITAWYTH